MLRISQVSSPVVINHTCWGYDVFKEIRILNVRILRWRVGTWIKPITFKE